MKKVGGFHSSRDGASGREIAVGIMIFCLSQRWSWLLNLMYMAYVYHLLLPRPLLIEQASYWIFPKKNSGLPYAASMLVHWV
jgi:hypothetical protein